MGQQHCILYLKHCQCTGMCLRLCIWPKCPDPSLPRMLASTTANQQARGWHDRYSPSYVLKRSLTLLHILSDPWDDRRSPYPSSATGWMYRATGVARNMAIFEVKR